MCRFDLHVHTKYSKDATIDPKNILNVLDKKKLKGIAITDHDTVRGGLIGKELAYKLQSKHIIIVGTEVKTEIGDILGLFLNREIKSRNSLEVLEEIKSQNGISILAHPFRGTYIPRLFQTAKIYSQEFIQRIDFIEAENARSRTQSNLKAKKLATAFGKPITGGSDAHFYAEIGSVAVNFGNRNINTEDDVKRCLLESNYEIERGHVLMNNFGWYALTASLSYLNRLGLR